MSEKPKLTKRRAENREKAIAYAMDRRGWTREEAEFEVDRAVGRLGITYVEYKSKEFCILTDEEQDRRAQYIKELSVERKQRIQGYIESTIKKTGWTMEKAKEEMDRAKAATGAVYECYDKYDFAFLSEEEQIAKYEEIKDDFAVILETRRLRDLCIWKTMWIRNIDRETATQEVEETVAELGISYREYNKYTLNRYEPADKKWAYESQRDEELELEKDISKNLVVVSEQSGKSVEALKERYDYLSDNFGCDWEEFFDYKLYDVPDSQIKGMLFLTYMRRIGKRYNKDRVVTRICVNKEWTNKYLSKYINRKWTVNRDISLEDFKSLFKDQKGVIYKPNYGLKGKGIELINFDGDIEMAYKKVMSYSKGVVEEIIHQHPDMNRLNPDSVNCLRIFTVSSKNKPVLANGSKKDLGFVSLKIGRSGSIVDNFSSGGMVAVLNIESGVIETDAVFKNLDIAETHPETGVKIKGFQVPFYKESLSLVNKIIDEMGICGTVGWDIAISETGPELVELNFGPGAGSLQGPYWPERKGMKDYMSKYLWDEELYIAD